MVNTPNRKMSTTEVAELHRQVAEVRKRQWDSLQLLAQGSPEIAARLVSYFGLEDVDAKMRAKPRH